MNLNPSQLRWWAVFFLCSVAPGMALAGDDRNAAGQRYPKTRQALISQIHAAMRQNAVVGLSIALIDDQTVVWSQGFGYADRALRIKAAPETLYRAGSISKLFTATAAMRLVEQGRFDLDQPIQTYVPRFSIRSRFPQSGAITPRLLMTHHAGLPTDYFKGWFTAMPFADTVEHLADDYVAFPPNQLLSYSNLGFSVLGRALESACGKPYAACLNDILLQPLGMRQASFDNGPAAKPLMAKGYEQGRESVDAVLRDTPAGGLNASVLDLSRLIRMVFGDGAIDGQRILSAGGLAEMLRPQNADVALDFDTRVGLAWFLERSPGGFLLAMHDGGIGSFHSLLIIAPDLKLGVVVLTNTAEASGWVATIANQALPSMATERGETSAGPAATAKASAESLPAEAFLGTYAAAEAGTFRIRGRGQRLILKLFGKSHRLKPVDKGGYAVTLPGVGQVLLARTDSDGHALLSAETANGKALFAEKIAPRDLSPVWRGRLGRYVLADADSGIPRLRLRLFTRRGYLFATGRELGERILIPVSETEAVLAGLGRALGETLAFGVAQGRPVLRYSGLRFERN